MSAVPGEAEQARPVLERRRRARPAACPRAPASQSTRPGIDGPGPGRHDEALERREAHRRVDRAPVATAASEAPAPRWQVTIRSVARPAARAAPPRAATRTRATGRGTRTGGAPALAPLARQRVGRGGRRASSAWNAVSKQATARHVRQDALTASSAASDFGWWSGARSVSAAKAAHRPSSSSRDRAAEPRPAVDDAVADGVDRAQAVRAPSAIAPRSAAAARRRQVARRRRPVVGVEDPQLEAARARVDDEDPHRSAPAHASGAARSSRGSPGRPRRARGCTRARSSRLVDHLLAQCAGPRRRGPAPGR